MFIYLISNDVNFKAYVGLYSGSDLRIRWIRHRACSRGNSRLAIHRAMRKHGFEKFRITAIWSGHFPGLSKKESLVKLGELERYYIRCFRTKGPLGYNAADGGTVNAGFRHTEETKAKLRAKIVSAETRAKMGAIHKGKTISEAHREANRQKLKGNTHLLGHIPSVETRKKLSVAGMGRIVSAETRAKKSARNKELGIRPPNTPDVREKIRLSLVGLTRTPEQCLNISKALKGKPKSPEHREKLRQASLRWYRMSGGTNQ